MPTNSATDFATRALRLLNAIDSIDTPSADMVQAGFAALNEMLDNWAIQRQTVYTIARSVFPLTGGIGSYTLGTGGVWNIARPSVIDRVSIIPTNSGSGNTGPMEIPIGPPLDIAAYQRIAIKTATGQYPTRIYWDRGWTNGLSTVYVYPVPIAGLAASLEQPFVQTIHSAAVIPWGVPLRVATGTTDRLGQALTFPSASTTVSTGTLRLFRQGTPTGSVWLTLQSWDIGPTGTVLATSALVDVTTIGSVAGIASVDDVAEVAFAFPSTAIPAGVVYLVLHGNYVRSDTDNVLWGGIGLLATPPVPPDAFMFNGTTISVATDLSFAYCLPALSSPTGPSIVLYTPTALTQFADFATQYTFPPGYAKAIRYNLALELAPELGIAVPPEVMRNAALSLGDLKRANHQPLEARFDRGLVGRGAYDILSDEWH